MFARRKVGVRGLGAVGIFAGQVRERGERLILAAALLLRLRERQQRRGPQLARGERGQVSVEFADRPGEVPLLEIGPAHPERRFLRLGQTLVSIPYLLESRQRAVEVRACRGETARGSSSPVAINSRRGLPLRKASTVRIASS